MKPENVADAMHRLASWLSLNYGPARIMIGAGDIGGVVRAPADIVAVAAIDTRCHRTAIAKLAVVTDTDTEMRCRCVWQKL